MNDTMPLPVIAGAYKRLVRTVNDPLPNAGKVALQVAREHAANAQSMARMSVTLWNPTSGTGLPPDVKCAIYERTKSHLDAATRRLALGTVRISGHVLLAGPNETNDVIGEALIESCAKFSELFERSCIEAIREISPDATVRYTKAALMVASDATSATLPIEERVSWVKDVYELVRLGQTSKALRVIFTGVEGHFKKMDLVTLAQVLVEVDLARLNPATMTGLLRISGRGKSALSPWSELLKRVRAELLRRNEPDLPGLLVGLGS